MNMSDSDGSEDDRLSQDGSGEDLLVSFLSSNRSLLSKSSTPDFRVAKNKDLQSLEKLYGDSGIIRSAKQIRKAINNL